MYMALMLGLPLMAASFFFVLVRISGKRLPALVWFIGPAIVAVFGLCSLMLGMHQTVAATAMAPLEVKSSLLAAGSAVAPLPDQLGLGFISLALGLGAFGLGLAARGTATSPDRSYLRATAAIFAGILGVFGIFLFGGDSNPMAAPSLALSVLIASISVALVAAISPTDEDHQLVSDAGLIATVGLTSVAALSQLWVSLDKALIYRAISHAEPELHQRFLSAGLDALGGTMAMGLMAVLCTSALIPIALVGRLQYTRTRWRQAAVVAGVLLVVVGLRIAGAVKIQHDAVLVMTDAAPGDAEPSLD